MRSRPVASPIRTNCPVSHTHQSYLLSLSLSPAAIGYGVGPSTLQPAPSQTQAPPPPPDRVVQATDNPPGPADYQPPHGAPAGLQPVHYLQQHSPHPTVNNHTPPQQNSVQPTNNPGVRPFNPGQLPFNPGHPPNNPGLQPYNPGQPVNPGPSVSKPPYNPGPAIERGPQVLPTVERQTPVKTSRAMVEAAAPLLLPKKPPAKPPEPEIPSFVNEEPSDHGNYCMLPPFLHPLSLPRLQQRSWPMHSMRGTLKRPTE